jgi:hypothetical protein
MWTTFPSGRCGASEFVLATAAGASLTRCWTVPWRMPEGAPAIEGYPVDNKGEKVDLTMAYVGTRTLFAQGGFTKVADTASVSGGFTRVLMRLNLP